MTSKKRFTMRNSYGIEIANNEDHAFLITLVITLDRLGVYASLI